ncbi:MAG TPA: undecaprenyl-phosphate glucose phosphotransferase [Kouleothrix sp.]|nr:undecaprenyl-phosphate glucose phosphotransferase [Kouleothrix sp.]HRC75647.1 undecaprenyl-phosphate glucose phosphotransferase [Kouleothrix sp.]
MAAISSAPRPRAASGNRLRPRPWVARLLLTLVLMGCDALAINSSFIGAYRWGLAANSDLQTQLAASGPYTARIFILLYNVIVATTFAATGLYALKRGASRVDEAFKVVVALSLSAFVLYLANALLSLGLFNGDDLPIDQQVVALAWLAAIVLTMLLRLLYRRMLALLRQRGVDTRRVLIVGAREPGRLVYETIRRNPRLGYRIQGFLSDHTAVGTLIDGVPVLGRTQALGKVIRATHADEVIIALSGRSSNEVLDIVALAEDESVEIKLYPDAFQLITNNEVSIGDVSGLPLIGVKNVALDNPLNRALKRMLDIVVAVLVLTFSSPLMLLIAALIRLDSRGPVFFAQERVGLDGKPFPTIKFRTMRVDAPALGNWTTKDDPRVTGIGAFLRRYSLDELPQFMNVLRGEMSVVGPRPEQQVWVEKFSQSIPRYMRRHKLKAGITGWAQVNGLRGDTSIEERTRYDLYYIDYWSLLFDIKIIIQTAIAILQGENRGY